MKNILLVGGAGYIGSHTVKHLEEIGYSCVVFDNLVYGHEKAINKSILVKGDLLDILSIKKVFKDYEIDGVIHFAAFAYVGESVFDPQKYYINNIVGTLNLLNVMLENNIKKIVFSSSCATYGEPEYTPIDENHPQNPINPYGQTKLIVEKILSDYKLAYGFKYICLRYFNAAGSDPKGTLGESHNPETHLIPLVLKAIKDNSKSIKVFGTDYETPDGTCIRDYIHVDDLASAHRLSYEKLDVFNGNINLGTGVGTSVKEVIHAAEQVSGLKCPVEFTARRAGDPAILFSTNSKAKEILGWSPKYKTIKDIIQTAWVWENNPKF